jgi:hypothetical protein
LRDWTLTTLACNRFHDKATNWCQWAQGLTPQSVLEGRNGICRVWQHCREQMVMRGIESRRVPAEL